MHASPSSPWSFALSCALFVWFGSGGEARAQAPEPTPIPVGVTAPAPAPLPEQAPIEVPAPHKRSARAVINGVVKNALTGEALEGAYVILSCSCLADTVERVTNTRGIYAFTDLPAGVYTVTTLHGKAVVNKIVELPRGAKYRVNASLDPASEGVETLIVTATPLTSSPTTLDDVFDRPREVPVYSTSCCVGKPSVRDKQHNRSAFELQRSMINDADARLLVGGPEIRYHLH